MANWQYPTVGELIDAGHLLVSDGYRVRNEELGCAGTPFVRGGDIGDGVIDTAPKDHVRPEFEHRIASKLSLPGDTAFITKGTVGRAGFLRRGQPAVVFAPQVAYWRSLNTEILDPRFVFHFIRSRLFQNALEAVMTRGAMVADYVSIAEQRRFRVPLPPIGEQRRISVLLGLLDDKIALNAQMNATLEAMARAVFEDWFVRFGPVHAKAEGRAPPGLAPDLAALFPDRLTETPDGEVPEGWSFASLGSAANHIRETLKPGDFPGEMFAHFSLPAFDNGAEPDRVPGSDIRSQKFAVPRNAVLLSKLNPVTPRVWLADYGDAERAVASTEFLVLVAREGWNREWLYCQSVQPRFRIELQSLVTGTSNSHQRAQPQAIMAFRVMRPTPSILTAFQAAVTPMLDRVLANRRETRTLTALRNLLLPRLMSGKLRLRDAERAVEAAL